MKRKLVLTMIALGCLHTVLAQQYRWNVGVDYFFDNTEYDGSSYIDSETMNGVWLNPLGRIVWDGRHSVNAGVNLLKIPGMDKALDKVDVTMYYQYKAPKILFRAGAFPRKEVLGDYNNFFFKDSVNHFIPLIQGVFVRLGDERTYATAWFDRTGYATPDKREHFFVGLSGKASKGIFFADFQSYMFHYSNTRPPTKGVGVSENLQLQASAGVQIENRKGLAATLAAGTLIGYERDRRSEMPLLHKPVGFIARGDIEYCGLGTKNLLYAGAPRMKLFDRFGGDLYWGTPFLQSRFYLENEWYVRIIESDRVNARFNCNLHFTEGKLLFQQMLTVSANIGTLNESVHKGLIFPWKRLFK
ncbi:MAG TPA: hypothetical protein DDZ96_07865 [Porphyromonadaceae bacterium]|uniref:hypothetical protein n=1 Tax=Limibacterium fermenti TaxID=3229863 RepID=UPI000E84FBEF|nr:hypothetical protein [Porphyromonadaceae bacterium]HBL33720.1 hypothetical protein [Porphyromonadaceae bacterium]HBX20572.1 hypothetical protein [Porphyromonadaceae bacterium]HBX45178.1 hypothetical protein [Porphyromonadaceae bacterium]HCM22037.1 hypothetical protein [Porphyromonadaceae bacterium]